MQARAKRAPCRSGGATARLHVSGAAASDTFDSRSNTAQQYLRAGLDYGRRDRSSRAHSTKTTASRPPTHRVRYANFWRPLDFADDLPEGAVLLQNLGAVDEVFQVALHCWQSRSMSQARAISAHAESSHLMPVWLEQEVAVC